MVQEWRNAKAVALPGGWWRVHQVQSKAKLRHERAVVLVVLVALVSLFVIVDFAINLQILWISLERIL